MLTADISTEELFEHFRIKFPYTRVVVHFDCMVYSIKNKKFADSIATEAKKLIREQQLPLHAAVRRGLIDATLVITQNKSAI